MVTLSLKTKHLVVMMMMIMILMDFGDGDLEHNSNYYSKDDYMSYGIFAQL